MNKTIRLLAAFLLLAGQLFAQTDPIKDELNHIFQFVNKTQIPTGYLDEYGPQFAEKKYFNGTLGDSNTVQDITAFRFLYNDVADARINTTMPAMPSTDDVDAAMTAQQGSGYTPLVLLAAQYATLRPDALAANLFSHNGNDQLFDVPGRPESPYLLANFFAACPIAERSASTNTITLRYVPALFYTNVGMQVSSVAVDFLHGGGYQTLPANANLSQTYTDSSGYKKFALRITCTNGSSFECYSRQFVRVVPPISLLRYAPFPNLSNPTFDIAAVHQQHAEAKVYIRYSSLRQGTALANKIVKPFVVVEGYDINDVAPLIDEKNYSINTLLEEWERIPLAVNDFDLNNALDSIGGYDLIFVDYYTMDSIENNAKVLEKVMDEINSRKVNNQQGLREKNVVMGISLGGVLARYTLAKMTKTRGTASTDTRLLLTYDSPHQGGNVPLGFQHYLYDFGQHKVGPMKLAKASEKLKQFYKLSEQPATAQLLLLRASDGNGTVHRNTFFAPGGPYRTMVDFNPTDNQPNYEFKAIAQGSQCGQPVMPPNAAIIDSDGNAGFWYYLAGLWVSKFRFTIKINALPAQGTSALISYVRVQRNVKLFGFIGTGWKNVDTARLRMSPPGDVVPWDIVPGGTSSPEERSGGLDINENFPYDGKHWDISYLFEKVLVPIVAVVTVSGGRLVYAMPFKQKHFTTVPINSALDIQNFNAQTFTRSHIFPLDGRANSAAVKYIANESFTAAVGGQATTLYNYEHADFTKRQAQWMFNEMEGKNNDTLNCQASNECFGTSIFQINGNSPVCAAEPFSIFTTPSTSIVWSVWPQNLLALSCTNCPQTVGSRLANGIVTLSANITACQQNKLLTKVVTIGNPAPEGIVGPGSNLCSNGRLSDKGTFRVVNPQSGTTYDWQVNGAFAGAGTSIVVDAGRYAVGNHQIRVRSTNSCGTSNWFTSSFVVVTCGRMRLASTPNPTTKQVTITLQDEINTAQTVDFKSEMQVELVQVNTKQTVKKWKFTKPNKQYTLQLAGVKSGQYVLVCTVDGNRISQQIIVQ
ncbi:MAG: hypothetical protein EAY75_01600 [Bacteroidetes bacterium]|nr:MAG: hypothetical protein EAY75_01600 [Bacteroidota bacterium]